MPALLDCNDDRLAFLRNKEINSPRPLCRARVPDEVNSLESRWNFRQMYARVMGSYFGVLSRGDRGRAHAWSQARGSRSDAVISRQFQPAPKFVALILIRHFRKLKLIQPKI